MEVGKPFFQSSCLLFFFFFFFFTKLLIIGIRQLNLQQLSGPPTHPFLGCLISFYKNKYRLLDWYTQLLSESPTQTIAVTRLGARRTIVTANPDNIEYMLKTKFHNYPKGKPFTEILEDLLGQGIFNVDGELWHTQRKLASHGFSTASLREYVTKMLNGLVRKRLMPALEAAARERSVVDMQELLRRLAFDAVCKVSLGTDPTYLDLSPAGPYAPSRLTDFAVAIDVATAISARRASAPLFMVWKIKRLLGIGSERHLKEAIRRVHSSVAELIRIKRKEKEEKEKEENWDLLSRLISDGHGDQLIRDIVISFIMAGRDTTSAALTWFFWLISRHLDVEKKVVEEAATKEEENGEFDYQSLKEMKFLKACLCESMRLYPPVAWDSKHAVDDDTLPDGTRVGKGDRVTYFPYGVGRMEVVWGKDWPEFKPERWLKAASQGGGMVKICPYKFPVFQGGPRVCLGQEMAFIQMQYVAASVLREFKLREASDLQQQQRVFVPLLTAHMAGGFNVTVHKR